MGTGRIQRDRKAVPSKARILCDVRIIVNAWVSNVGEGVTLEPPTSNNCTMRDEN